MPSRKRVSRSQARSSSTDRYLVFLIEAVVLFALLAAIYSSSHRGTPHLSSVYFNNTQKVVGNSSHMLSIALIVDYASGAPANGNVVNDSVGMGSVTPCTTMDGVCTITYKPPSSTVYQNTTVTVWMDGSVGRIPIEITPN